MAAERLYGTELIDCARANGNQGVEVAVERCGYGGDRDTFEQEMQKACDHIGVEYHGFEDLVAPKAEGEVGVEIAPDSPTQL